MTLRSGPAEIFGRSEACQMRQNFLGGLIMDRKTNDLDREASF
jgi:hypothetical protein